MAADTGKTRAIFGSVLTVAAAGLGAATAYALSLAAIQAASFSPAFERLAGWLPRGSVAGVQCGPGLDVANSPFSGVLAFVSFLALGWLALHSVIFRSVVFLYSRRGWPPYREDLDADGRWPALCWKTWRGSAWAAATWFPLTGAIWALAWQFFFTTVTGPYPVLLDFGPIAEAGSWLALVLGHGLTCSALLRREVVGAVQPGQRRCPACGYLLYGLPTPCCPECGRVERGPAPIAFGLRWGGRRMGTGRVWGLFAAVFVSLVLMPAWLPWLKHAIWQGMPRGFWTGNSPVVLAKPNPDAFAVRLGQVVRIRQGNAQGSVQFSASPEGEWKYESRFWSNAGDAQTRPPDLTQQAVLSKPAWSPVNVGPWVFHYSNGAPEMGWLYLPDGSFYAVRILDAVEFAPSPAP